jgi:MFS family permease
MDVPDRGNAAVEALRRQRRAFVLHAVVTFAAANAFKVVASYSAIDLGFTATELGLLASSFAVPPFLAAFAVGRWTDRIGGLKVTLVGDVMMLAAAVAALLFSGALSLILAAAAFGLGALLSILGQHAQIGATIPRHEQERVFASLFSGNAIGQMLGPLAATLLGSMTAADGELISVRTGLLVAIGLGAVGVATLVLFGRAAWRQSRDTADQPPAALRALGEIVAIKGAGAMLCFNAIIVAVIDMLSIFLPAWGAERQIAPAIVGALLSLRSAASILVRLAMVRIIALLGRRNVLVGSAILTAASLAVLPFADLAVACLAAIVLGCALGLGPPMSLAWVSLSVPARLRGSAMGLRMFANRLSQAIVPATVGLVSAGTLGVFLTTAALVAATSLLVFRLPFGEPGPAGQ